MSELDEIWARKLAEATENARLAGRRDVADYLALRAANDAVRTTGVGWLFETLICVAAEIGRDINGILIEREEPHNFALRGANMVGSLMRLRRGVRCMTLEAGWTRTPSDGFMRGGALAAGRIAHFGMPGSSAELALIIREDSPIWMTVREDKPVSRFETAGLREHFLLFYGG